MDSWNSFQKWTMTICSPSNPSSSLELIFRCVITCTLYFISKGRSLEKRRSFSQTFTEAFEFHLPSLVGLLWKPVSAMEEEKTDHCDFKSLSSYIFFSQLRVHIAQSWIYFSQLQVYAECLKATGQKDMFILPTVQTCVNYSKPLTWSSSRNQTQF